MQNLYENFLLEKFYTTSNYTLIEHVNQTKIFLHEKIYNENFLHKNKANFCTLLQRSDSGLHSQ